jgi:lipoprotein-anchoring transpeptidase ErfK/SrfK
MKRISLIIFLLVCFSAKAEVNAQSNNKRPPNYISDFIIDYISIKYPSVSMDTLLYVGVERQKMYLFIDGKVEKIYDVSTSRNGAGTKSGSEQTPIGLHVVNGKYGEGLPKGSVLRGKKFTGQIADIQTEPITTGKDDITSRILTIKGLEEGVNKGGDLDSYNRKIYIHGTAEEGLIGQPASHGCVRMRNEDIIELFDIVNEGVNLIILDN